MRVLVVDDDAEVRQVVRRSLEREAFAVAEAADPDAALSTTRTSPVDVAIVDLHLPMMSGLELMAQLRREDPDLPVIMLSGAGSEADRVRGLVGGADDYVVKPFSGRELAARVIAAGRRRAARGPESIDAGGFQVDVAGRAVLVGGEPLDLTRREFDLLAFLAAHPGRTFSRGELLSSVWASSADWQSEATVTEHVRRLRTKLELDPTKPMRLVTVRGVGYRFDPAPGAGSGPAANGERAEAPVVAGLASGTDLTDDPTVVIAGDVLVHANRSALALVGARDASEALGRRFYEFVAPQSLGASMARRQGAQQGRWPRPEVITIRRLDGEDVHVEVASSPVLWEGVPASQVTLWDLAGDTSKLRELATGLRSEVAEAVIITDPERRIRSFNPAAEVLYGWREEEVIGRDSMEVLPWLRDDLTFARVRDAFQRHGRWHGVVVQRRRDGTAVTVRSSATLLRDDAGQPVGIISVNRPASQAPPPAVEPDADASLIDEIRRGIERREFTVHYQPVVQLDDGAWVGVEALVRWQHPERGLLAPAAFIDVAERSGAIVDLGQLVLDEATRQWQRWHDAGLDLHVAVNLSGRQLIDPNLTDRVGAALAAVSMPQGALRLEVTETALVEDLNEASEVLARLVELGAELAIDDFGTGWASLTYLREFPVHALKIDRVFVAGLGTNVSDTAIASSILALGSELGLAVVAEGIETADQLARLRQLGCELGQGYLFAAPAPAAEIAKRWQ